MQFQSCSQLTVRQCQCSHWPTPPSIQFTLANFISHFLAHYDFCQNCMGHLSIKFCHVSWNRLKIFKNLHHHQHQGGHVDLTTIGNSRVLRGRTVVPTSSVSSSSASVSSFFFLLFASNLSLILFFGSTRGCFRRDSNVPMPFSGSLVNRV